MNSISFTSFLKLFEISHPRGIGLLSNNGANIIAAVNKDQLVVFSGKGDAVSYKIGESFDFVNLIPGNDTLVFLARNNLQYIFGIDERDASLEYSQCEFALYDCSKQKILRRFVFNDCEICAISAWENESGVVRLAAVFNQYSQKFATSSLYFYKSYADVMDLEFEVLNTIPLSRSSDEIILTASCLKNRLIFLDDFHQTRLFDLEKDKCFREFLDDDRYPGPLDISTIYQGIIDFVSEDSYAFHHKESCYLLNLDGKIICEYGLSGDASRMFGPQKFLSHSAMIVSNPDLIGLAEQSVVVRWIFEEDA